MQQRHEAATVHPAAVTGGTASGARQLQQGRSEIDVGDRRVERRPLPEALREVRRRTDHERHPQVFLVGQALGQRHPVLAEGVAVVGDEGDHRLPQLAAAAQRADQARDAPVDGLQRGEPAAVVTVDVHVVVDAQRDALDELGLVGDVALGSRRVRRRDRIGEGVGVAGGGDRSPLAAGAGATAADVRRRLLDLHVERPAPRRIPVHELVRVVVDLLGQVGARRLRLAIDREDRVGVVDGHRRRPPIPAGSGLEPVLLRVPVHVLADVNRLVAGLPEPFGEHPAHLLQPGVALAVADQAVVVGVLAGQHLRPRGAALRAGDDALRKRRAVIDEQALGLRHDERAELLERLIVGDDQDQVRALAGALALAFALAPMSARVAVGSMAPIRRLGAGGVVPAVLPTGCGGCGQRQRKRHQRREDEPDLPPCSLHRARV